MKPKEHSWKATVGSGHRMTVPGWIIEDFELKEGDKLYVTVTPVSKSITADPTVIGKG